MLESMSLYSASSDSTQSVNQTIPSCLFHLCVLSPQSPYLSLTFSLSSPSHYSVWSCVSPLLPSTPQSSTPHRITEGKSTTKRKGVYCNLTQSLRHCQTPTRDVTLTLSHTNTLLHRWTVHSARAPSLTATARRLGARLRVCTLGVRGTSGEASFWNEELKLNFSMKKNI